MRAKYKNYIKKVQKIGNKTLLKLEMHLAHILVYLDDTHMHLHTFG